MSAILTAASLLAMPWPDAQLTTRSYRPPELYITVYDWGLEGQNCDWGECEWTALVRTGDDILGWTAACPSDWLGHVTTTVVSIWGEEFWCVDAFGRLEDRRLTRIKGRLVYRIDIASRPAIEHPWNNEFVPNEDWSREWRSMTEFYSLRAGKSEGITPSTTGGS